MSPQWKWGRFAFLSVVAFCFSLLFPIVAHATCPAGMISYWTLDETAPADPGNTYQDAVGGHDGLVGAGKAAPSPAAGKVHGGQLFSEGTNPIGLDSADTGISVEAGLDFCLFSFSIEFWMKSSDTAPSETKRCVAFSHPFFYWLVDVIPAGNARFAIADDSPASASVTASVIHDGQFHHVVAVRDADADQILLYVDNLPAVVASAPSSIGFCGFPAVLTIGYWDDPYGQHFNGIIDDVAIYGRALKPAEIQQHYKNGLRGLGYCGGGTAPWIALLLGD